MAISLLCVAAPAGAETVGIILTRGSQMYAKAHDVFLDSLREAGLGGRVKVITQTPYADPVAWGNAARKLIALDVDIIVTYGSAPTFAVLKERSNIPVVYAGLSEALLPRLPGKRTTGTCVRPSMSALLGYLMEAGVADRLGVLYSASEEDSTLQALELSRYGKRYGFSVTTLNIKKPADVPAALYDTQATALFLTSSLVISSVHPTLMGIAHSKRLPTASLVGSEETYATITITPKSEELGTETSKKVARLLSGTPVEKIEPACTRDVEIVFNLKEARALGIRIPMNLVTEATRILQ